MDTNLLEEYKISYGIYENYNQQILEFKGWSVTIGIAALIAAYTKPVSSFGRIGVLIAAFAAIPFWLTETFWKLFQRSYLDRILEIEACARGQSSEATSCNSVQIATSWKNAFQESKWDYWIGGAFDPHVLLPHLALLVVGVALAIWCPPGRGSAQG